jgi:hypothetical protein
MAAVRTSTHRSTARQPHLPGLSKASSIGLFFVNSLPFRAINWDLLIHMNKATGDPARYKFLQSNASSAPGCGSFSQGWHLVGCFDRLITKIAVSYLITAISRLHSHVNSQCCSQAVCYNTCLSAIS